jgi:formamidopyrimidine-DNA glycosylase
MIKQMPELPDIQVYIEQLAPRLVGQPLTAVTIAKPFVLRSVEPPIADAVGRRFTEVRRSGKRIVLGLEGDRFLVIHLMIAGRLRWRDAAGVSVPAEGAAGAGKGRGRVRKPPAIAPRLTLATFTVPPGTLYFTEAGTTRRASLHYVQGEAALAAFDRGGLEVLGADRTAFAARLASENHTLKRTLTDPRLFSGIGNAYSDEILHRARLSPMALSTKMSDADVGRLYDATQDVLTEWTNRLRAAAGDAFPEKVTAFHDEMAVHGRYGQPCPDCGAPVQRIRYASNETNYCARCQTGGRRLADRAMSRLLKEDWPRSIDDVE